MSQGHHFRGRRRWGVAVTAAVTLLAWGGSASAQVPCEESAIDQYVECLPTDQGSNAPGATDENRTPLSGPALAAIRRQGGEDAELLTQLATSSNYGAPRSSLRIPRSERESAAALAGDDASAGEALSAAVSAVQGGDAGRLVGLLVALFLIAAAALGLAVLRQKRRAS